MIAEMSTAPVDARSGDTGGSSTAPRAAGGDGLRVRTLRPRRTLVRSIGFTVAALAIPLIAIELWVLRDSGAWALVVAAASVIVLAAATLFAWYRYRRTQAVVSRFGIVERGFFGFIHSVAARDISSVVRLQLYRRAALETTDQLFVLDTSGRCVFRMRGIFWDDATFEDAVAALGIEPVVWQEPVTLAELRRSNPEYLFWFERLRLVPRPSRIQEEPTPFG